MKTIFIKGLLIGFALLLIMPSVISCAESPEGTYLIRDDVFTLAGTDKLHLNKNARQFLKAYLRENRRKLISIKKRSRGPFSIADSVLNSYALPCQLKYLAVIESELKPRALSRVGAVGPWQLMPQTARILGLKVTGAHDERMQYGKSTKAAARYLKDLYAEFGDWLLVLAAYNGGTGAVHHAIHMAGSRNFWQLQSYLPAESRGHVKKFIATLYFFEGRTSVTNFCCLPA